jgi:hypothetical protein
MLQSALLNVRGILLFSFFSAEKLQRPPKLGYTRLIRQAGHLAPI